MKEKGLLFYADNPSLADPIRQSLSREGHALSSFITAKPIAEVADPLPQDARTVVLCLADGQTDVTAAVKVVRARSETVTLFVFAAGGTPDTAAASLDAGADGFRSLPCDPREAAALVKAAVRLAERVPAAGIGDVLRVDNLEISLETYELKIGGKRVVIPPMELELLYYFISNPGRVFTRDNLLDKVWGYDYLGDSRTVDVHVKRLRGRLAGASDKWALKTVWGVGYKFEITG